MRRLILGLAAFIFLVDLAGSRAADTREQLIDAWHRRQNSIRSFQFTWSGKHYARADVAVTRAQIRLQDKPVDNPDLACDTQMALNVDEKGRYRFDVHGNVWSIEKAAYVPLDQIDIFDGPVRRHYSSRTVTVPYPTALTRKLDPRIVAGDRRSVAVMMVYRPFDATMNCFDREKLRLSGEQATIDGHPCVVVEQADRNSRKVWADTARDFLPVRYAVLGPTGSRSTQVNISYSKDAKYGWVPTAWTVGILDQAEKIKEGWQTTTVKYKLNEPTPESTFQPSYPAGTWVNDLTTKESYILLEGGKKRPVLPGEWNGKNYEELLHSKPRQPSRP